MRLRFLHSGPKTLVFLAVLSLAGTSWAQLEVWKAHYDGSNNEDEAVAVALTPDSTVVVTGSSVGTDATPDVATIKLLRNAPDSTGDTVWVRRWSAAGFNWAEEPTAMGVDDSGNIFVTGSVTAPDTIRYFTLKYLPDGTLAWDSLYAYGTLNIATALVPDNLGGVYVTGYSGSLWDPDFMTIHYSSDSTRRWRARFNGPGLLRDYAFAIARAPDGSVIVTGHSYVSDGTTMDYCTVKYDSLGDTMWVRYYDGSLDGYPAYEEDYSLAVAVDDSGYSYVAGEAGELGTWRDATTVKYSSNGDRIWVNRYDRGADQTEGAYRIALGSDGRVFLGGHYNSDANGCDFLAFCLSQTDTVPTVLWSAIFDRGSGIEDDDSLTGLAIDKWDNCYVTGLSNGSSTVDWMTIKYGPGGSEVWRALYFDINEDREPRAIAVNPQGGDVFVTGYDAPGGNDDDYVTIKYTQDDVGALRIILPQDSFRIGATVTPWAMVRNYGALTERDFPVRLDIGNLYTDAVNIESIPPYDSLLVHFSPWRVEERALGSHPVTCYTMLGADKNPANDTAYAQVTAVTVWEQLAVLPPGPKNAGVKDGGALAFVPDSLVFAFKGNNTTEFYAFNTRTREWVTKDTIPAVSRSGRKKRVKSGGRLAADTLGHVFATKGNNTFEFWRYTAPSDSWKQMDDVPYGGANKKVKSGTGLAYVPWKNSLYLVKGNNTLEFYVFDVTNDTWLPRSSVPLGSANKKAKDGSVMAYDGSSTIYFLKGNTYEFWSYNVATDTWTRRRDLRNSYLSTKKRKMKKGAGMAFDPEYNRVYVTKGYKLTEFWYYDVGPDSWVETTDNFPVPPAGKPPYAGSDLCYGAGKIYALKGNKTNEFYRYNANFPYNPLKDDEGQQASALVSFKLNLTIAPNPFLAHTALRYALPQAGRVRLVLYDVTGRLARTVVDDWQARGEYSATLRSDGLAAGIYIAKLWFRNESTTLESSRKLLITR
jgi:hypothetical protein